MLRYIKVNDQWLDTLIEQKEKHRVFMVIDNKVYCLNEDNSECEIGCLEDEKDSSDGLYISMSKPPKIEELDLGIWRRVLGK